MQGVLTLKRTIFVQLELTLRITTILFGRIVFLFTFGALQSNFLYGTFFLCFTHLMLLGECSPYSPPNLGMRKKRALERT